MVDEMCWERHEEIGRYELGLLMVMLMPLGRKEPAKDWERLRSINLVGLVAMPLNSLSEHLSIYLMNDCQHLN